jgi:hypothetical protein
MGEGEEGGEAQEREEARSLWAGRESGMFRRLHRWQRSSDILL